MVGNEAKIKGDPGKEDSIFPNEVSRRIGDNINRLLETRSTPENKLTQGKMAAELWKAKPPHVNNIVKGKKNLSLKKLIEIADYFNADIYELFIRPGLTIIDRDKK